MLFGASEDITGLPESREETRTKAIMQKAWAAFAKDPVHGLTRAVGWPSYNPQSTFARKQPNAQIKMRAGC